ncbi:hypothetical protein EON77_17400 [bacterium]|nr:MAG: hypothetical protein EON77_17400 [bacterium]
MLSLREVDGASDQGVEPGRADEIHHVGLESVDRELDGRAPLCAGLRRFPREDPRGQLDELGR